MSIPSPGFRICSVTPFNFLKLVVVILPPPRPLWNQDSCQFLLLVALSLLGFLSSYFQTFPGNTVTITLHVLPSALVTELIFAPTHHVVASLF